MVLIVPVEVKWRRFSLCQSTQLALFMQTLTSNQNISSKCNMYGPLTFLMLHIVVKGVVKGALTVVTFCPHSCGTLGIFIIIFIIIQVHDVSCTCTLGLYCTYWLYTPHPILCFCGCCLLSGPHVPQCALSIIRLCPFSLVLFPFIICASICTMHVPSHRTIYHPI